VLKEVAKATVETLKPPNGYEDPGPWRRKVWVSLLVIIAVLALHFSIDGGFAARFGISAVVRADQLENRVAQVEGRLNRIEGKQDSALRLALATEICRLYHLRNMAVPGSPLRAQLELSYEEKQNNFSDINEGARYSIVECSPPQ